MQTIVRGIGSYRSFTLRVEAPRLERKPIKLVLSTEEAGDVFDRVFDEITSQSVFAVIDAGLRDIADRIARNQQENATDAQRVRPSWSAQQHGEEKW